MKIALVSGTFDPPHLGYLLMARMSLWTEKIDNVWFLPCWNHAFEKKPSSFEHRTNMLHAMINDCLPIDMERFSVCAEEKKIESTYSIEIINHLVNKYPEHSFTLVLGSDNYWKLLNWKNFSEVRNMINVLWVSRNGQPNLPYGETVIGYTNTDISSTQIRKLFKSNNDVSHLVSKSVIEYAKKHGLYK